MIVSRIMGLVLGYIFGLFPTGVLYGKAHNIDIRKHGSGNAGMTNSLRVLGWKAGVIVFFGDCLKAVAAMAIIWYLFRNQYPDAVKLLELYAGFGAVLGHNFPFYMKFKGGKGIASSVGIVFSFDWRMVPICAILFFASVVPTGFMSLGSLGILSGFFCTDDCVWTAWTFESRCTVFTGNICSVCNFDRDGILAASGKFKAPCQRNRKQIPSA